MGAPFDIREWMEVLRAEPSLTVEANKEKKNNFINLRSLKKKKSFFHIFFQLEETISSSFFHWNSEETHNEVWKSAFFAWNSFKFPVLKYTHG